MEKKTLLYVIFILLVSVTGYTLYASLNQPQEDTALNAYIMVNRYAYSSHPNAMVTITDEILDEYPVLKEAFRIESISWDWGKVHPTEWVICTVEEGEAIEELINSLPAEGEGSRKLQYLDNKFMIEIKYATEPPKIA